MRVMLSNADRAYEVIAKAARIRSQDLPARLLASCPLHAEATPSCMIDLAAKTFRCLGCGEEGRAVPHEDEPLCE